MVGPVPTSGRAGVADSDPAELGREVLACWDAFLDVVRAPSTDLSRPSRLSGWSGRDVLRPPRPLGRLPACSTRCSRRPAPAPWTTARRPRPGQRRARRRPPRRTPPSEVVAAVQEARDRIAGFFDSGEAAEVGRLLSRSTVGPAAGADPGARRDLRAGGARAGPRAVRCAAARGAPARPRPGRAPRRHRLAVRPRRRGDRAGRYDPRRRLAFTSGPDGWTTERHPSPTVDGVGVSASVTDLLDASSGRASVPQLLLTRRLHVQPDAAVDAAGAAARGRARAARRRCAPDRGARRVRRGRCRGRGRRRRRQGARPLPPLSPPLGALRPHDHRDLPAGGAGQHDRHLARLPVSLSCLRSTSGSTAVPRFFTTSGPASCARSRSRSALSPNGRTSSTSNHFPYGVGTLAVGADVGDGLVDQPAVRPARPAGRRGARAPPRRPARAATGRAAAPAGGRRRSSTSTCGPGSSVAVRRAPDRAAPAQQHRLLDLAAQRDDLDLDVVRQRLVVDARRDLHDRASGPGRASRAPGRAAGSTPAGRRRAARLPAGPGRRRRRRRGGQPQRRHVGADQRHVAAEHLGVGPREQQPGLVEVDPDRPVRQREQVAADRAAQVEHRPVEQPRAVRRQVVRRGLLQRRAGPPQLVAARVLGPRPPAQQRLLERERAERAERRARPRRRGRARRRTGRARTPSRRRARPSGDSSARTCSGVSGPSCSALGETRRVPDHSGAALVLRVLDRPAVGAASSMSLGSTWPSRPAFGVSSQTTPLSARLVSESTSASTRSPSPSRHHSSTTSTTSSESSVRTSSVPARAATSSSRAWSAGDVGVGISTHDLHDHAGLDPELLGQATLSRVVRGRAHWVPLPSAPAGRSGVVHRTGPRCASGATRAPRGARGPDGSAAWPVVTILSTWCLLRDRPCRETCERAPAAGRARANRRRRAQVATLVQRAGRARRAMRAGARWRCRPAGCSTRRAPPARPATRTPTTTRSCWPRCRSARRCSSGWPASSARSTRASRSTRCSTRSSSAPPSCWARTSSGCGCSTRRTRRRCA